MYLHWKKNEDWQDEGIRRVSMFLGESTHCSPLQANQQLHMRLEKKENNKQGLDGFVDLRYMEGHRKQLKNRRCVDPRRKATSPSASSRRRAPIHPPPSSRLPLGPPAGAASIRPPPPGPSRFCFGHFAI